VRRPPLLVGAVAAVAAVAAVVVAGAFSVPANALTVDGVSISRATLNRDLAVIQQNQAFGCYLDASVAVRSANQAALPTMTRNGGATYDTRYVDFWLSQQINNLLVEHLAASEHLSFDATALAAGRSDLLGNISSTLAEAAAATGQSAVCAPSGAAIVSTLPSAMVDELVRAQAAGDLVLSHAAGYGLGTTDLARFFSSHQSAFQTICLSGIQTTDQATANTVRSAIVAGEPFATAAQADSTDTQSAANGGALGCFSANEGAYDTVAADVKGLAVGQLSQPLANNGSYLLLVVTSEQPAAFDAVIPAVRQAILADGSAKATKQLSGLTKTARVSIDPRYGRWSGASGIGIQSPLTPPKTDLLEP